ncbi:MAG: hypothetical protein ACI9EF_003121 [Pseudohongiellaceae bacterium]|jgi:hypothetical protein
MNTLESELQSLQSPAVPAGLSASISSRIAHIDEQHQATSYPAHDDKVVAARRDRLAWPLALVGLSVGVGAQIYRLAAGESALDLLSVRTAGGLQRIVDLAQPSPALAVLGAGMLLALTGLFALQRDAPQQV